MAREQEISKDNYGIALQKHHNINLTDEEEVEPFSPNPIKEGIGELTTIQTARRGVNQPNLEQNSEN